MHHGTRQFRQNYAAIGGGRTGGLIGEGLGLKAPHPPRAAPPGPGSGDDRGSNPPGRNLLDRGELACALVPLSCSHGVERSPLGPEASFKVNDNRIPVTQERKWSLDLQREPTHLDESRLMFVTALH